MSFFVRRPRRLRLIPGAGRLIVVRSRSRRSTPVQRQRSTSRHWNLVMKHLRPGELLAAGEALGAAVAVTPSELVVAKAGLLRSGRIQRYKLRTVSRVEVYPSPSIHGLLIVARGASFMLLYRREDAADFDRIISLIRRWNWAGRQPAA